MLSNWLEDVRFTVPVAELLVRQKLNTAYVPFRWRGGGGFLANRMLRSRWRGQVLEVRGSPNLRFEVTLAGDSSGTAVTVRTHTGRVYQILTILAAGTLLGVGVGWERGSALGGVLVGVFVTLFFLAMFALTSLGIGGQHRRFLDDLRSVLR